MTVLIVEDNEMNRHLIETILQANDYDHVSAENGTDAVALAQTTTFDLILMDLQMPGLSGFSALESIRENERNAKTPVIAVTGNATRADEKRARSAGFDDFLKKPFRVDGLLEIIRKNMNLHKNTS